MSRFAARATDPIPASAPVAAAVRGAVDSIVQSSLVELFAAYGMAAAPLPRVTAHRPPSFPEVSAAVAFTRRTSTLVSGRLTLSVPEAVLDATKGGSAGALKVDWARELASQLLGRIKNRLLQFSVRLEAGVAMGIDSKALAARVGLSPGLLIYSARTLRGEIVVTFEGAPDESQLLYLGPVNVAAEGETILF
jgi:hypothetical protein